MDFLSVFNEELPDRYCDIWQQALNRFDLLQRLPVEVRLIIWKATLPRPRKIYLRALSSSKLSTLPTNPVTASINRESRETTLKTYRLLRVESQDDSSVERQIFWAPKTDTLRASLGDIVIEDLREVLEPFWNDVAASFATIQRLEIVDTFDMLSSNFSQIKDWASELPEVVARFTQLRSLVLHSCAPNDTQDMEEWLMSRLLTRQRSTAETLLAILTVDRSKK